MDGNRLTFVAMGEEVNIASFVVLSVLEIVDADI